MVKRSAIKILNQVRNGFKEDHIFKEVEFQDFPHLSSKDILYFIITIFHCFFFKQSSHSIFKEVEFQDFPHLSSKFYKNCTNVLTESGFKHLGDVEDQTQKAQSPDPRSTIRIMINKDSDIVGVIYHVKPKFPWPLFMFVMGIKSKIYEFETEFNNGYMITSTISKKGYAFADFPLLKDYYYPSNTSIEDLLKYHQNNVKEFLKANPNLTTIKQRSLGDANGMENRQIKIKRNHLKQVGWVTREYLYAQVGKNKTFMSDVYDEIQNILREENKTGPNNKISKNDIVLRLEKKFNINMPDDIRSWIDNDLHKNNCYGLEYGEPIDFEEYLENDEGYIWGGLMHPDTIPIVGNGCGDQLCLRIGKDGSVSEIIKWEHETSEWMPCGKTLAEALVFFTIISDELEIEDNEKKMFEWLKEQTGIDLVDLLEKYDNETDRLQVLLDNNIVAMSVYERLAENAMRTLFEKETMEDGYYEIVESLNISLDQFDAYCKRPETMPENVSIFLSKRFNTSIEKLFAVDWNLAKKYAGLAILQRENIAWPFLVLGDYELRHGNNDIAIDYYYRGVQSLKTTYGFTHTNSWSLGAQTDMCAQRLADMKDQISQDISNDGLFLAKSNPEFDGVLPLRKYWIEKAKQSEVEGKFELAYDCWYKAGWDDFYADDINEIIDKLIFCAAKCDFKALTTIGKIHRENCG